MKNSLNATEVREKLAVILSALRTRSPEKDKLAELALLDLAEALLMSQISIAASLERIAKYGLKSL